MSEAADVRISCDYLVVGAGSAGCIIANRLSADPSIRVVLVEAGPDLPPGQEPADVRSPSEMVLRPEYFWTGLRNDVSPRRTGEPFMQARVVGGGSTVNGMGATRATPDDFAEFGARGVVGWDWDDVLPYFKKLENDLDFNGPMHGDSGPIAIRRGPQSEWSPFCLDMVEAVQAFGLRVLPDFNETPQQEGVYAIPRNSTAEHRVSSAMGYLDEKTRRRENLQIVADCTVTSLSVANGRVTGALASATDARRSYSFEAGETIVCSGAVFSPALLLRSGIGPGGQLQSVGIEVHADRPGVGAGLQNHCGLGVGAVLKARGLQPKSTRHIVVLRAGYTLRSGQLGPLGVGMEFRSSAASSKVGRGIGVLVPMLCKPRSRGSVSLDPRDPTGLPLVQHNMLGHPDDLGALAECFRDAVNLLSQGPGKRSVNEIFITKRLAAPASGNSWADRAFDEAVGAALRGPKPLRRLIVGNAGIEVHPSQVDREASEQLVQDFAFPGGHVTSTCSIGAEDDGSAVVDSRCRVIGVAGLRVVDASIFPSAPSNGPNLPVFAIAERAADLVLGDRRKH